MLVVNSWFVDEDMSDFLSYSQFTLALCTYIVFLKVLQVC